MEEHEFAAFVKQPSTQSYLQAMSRGWIEEVVPRANQDALLRTWNYVSKPETVLEGENSLIKILAWNYRRAYIDRVRVRYTGPQQFRLGLESLDTPENWSNDDSMYEVIGAPVPTPEDVVCNELLSPELVEALDTLWPVHKDIAYRVWLVGDRQVDVAADLGITPSNLNGKLRLIKDKLRKALIDA